VATSLCALFVSGTLALGRRPAAAGNPDGAFPIKNLNSIGGPAPPAGGLEVAG
jgi:hypothetical protein